MGNTSSTLRHRSDQRECRDQRDEANASVASGRSLEASLLDHSCQEEEIIIEGEPLIVVKNCSACFNDRRESASVPLTLAENLEKISAKKAVIKLEDANFSFKKQWLNVARRLDVNPEVSFECGLQVIADNNYSTAMEKCLDWWIQNDSSASWERLIEAIAFYEPATGEEMRKSLGLYSTDVLKRNCDEEFIIRLSRILQPRHYTILAPYLLSQTAESVINEQEPDETLKALRMLQHWKDCWKEKATYEALVCVTKDALPSESEIVEFVDSLLDSISVCLSNEEVSDFSCVMNEEEKLAHQDAFRELRFQFAKVFSEGAASIVHKTDIDFNKVKLFVLMLCHQPIKAENMSQLMNLIATRISWFDYEIFERLLMEFGDEEHKQKLTDYKAELSKYLNQSILNIPRNIVRGLQPAELCNLSKVYIKIPDNESEMPNLYGSDVKDIKERIAEHIGLSDPECINFVSYRKGCIELVFLLVQKPEKPISNTEWDEERQEHKITGDIGKLLPDSFRKRNRLFSTSTPETKSMMKVEEKSTNPTDSKMRSRGNTLLDLC